MNAQREKTSRLTVVTGRTGRKRAVLYLRVSTPSQVNTDYDPEGISIPAQREACERRADELGADIVETYVEPGRSATTTEGRPRFQEMMARIKAEQDVDYVIVYARSRIHRNSIDAAITKRDLRKAGAAIVSIMDYTEDTAIGDLVATVLDGVNEYQSKASGADIRYKMGQKAKLGGTITKAPIGYLNQHIEFEGREVAIVVKDDERAPYLLQGFELYATGQYTAAEVLGALTAAGLRTRPTRKAPAQPLALSRFYDILADRYYLGIIEHQGEEYPGRHDALVTPELFDRVQRVLALHGGGGTRQRTHNHYLKGTLWCGRCGKRFIVMPGRGNGGTYFYFICRGRQDKNCTQPYVRIEAIEAAVTRHYAAVALTDDFRDRLRHQLDDALLGDLAGLSSLKKRLTARLAELDTKEDQYLDLVGDPGWPKEKLRRKVEAIRTEREEIATQLADTSSRLTAGRAFFLAALELLRDPQGFYERAGTSLKRAMNKVIFPKLFVDGEEIADHQLGEAVRDVVQAQALVSRLTQQATTTGQTARANPQNTSSPVPKDEATWSAASVTDLLAVVHLDHGSSRTVLVGLTGFEPATP
ncbi:recombinase family protein [Catenulispora rubra]|uniref:recombinase family protein n=1 Tax=Catenulispora rubra TaxID=280293 RepID=UPI0018920065|nr:recombinase family protein [Catenulispora rubra]